MDKVTKLHKELRETQAKLTSLVDRFVDGRFEKSNNLTAHSYMEKSKKIRTRIKELVGKIHEEKKVANEQGCSSENSDSGGQ